MTMVGYYGSDEYGDSPYGSVPPELGVQSAQALNGTHVQVNFTQLLDFTFSPLTIPSNYSISPLLTVVSVVQAASNAVVLTTSPQSNIVYTVTVTAARSTLGTILNPLQNSAQFTGFSLIPGYFAVATSVTRVRAVFSQVMLNDSNLSNPVNYTITDMQGNVLPVLSATPEQSINPQSVLLALGTNLGESDFYVCDVSDNIRTATGLNVLPPTSVFQWLQGANQTSVPLSLFTGEVAQLGPVQDFGGLVYFSPALNTPTPNSIIQIEEVDVCTTAYDTYTPPVMVDPPILFTYGGGIVPTPSPDPYLLNQCVLWAPFPRNFEAQIIVGFTGEANVEPMPQADDTSCSILIKEQYKYGYVALLNDPAYYLLPKSTPPEPTPPMFITAKNLSPIPPGGETIIVLHVSLRGEANMPGPIVDGVRPPMVATKVGHTSASMHGTSQLFAGAGPPPVILAQASLVGGSNMSAVMRDVRGARASIAGQAIMNATASGVIPPPLNEVVMEGGSNLSVFAGVRRALGTAIHASASLHVKLPITRGFLTGSGSTAEGSSSLSALADVQAQAHAQLPGQGQVVAIRDNTFQATSNLGASAQVVHAAHVHVTGTSSVAALVDGPFPHAAFPQGSSSASGLAIAKWAAKAAIQGTSAVFAHATVTHKAEAFPFGIATVSATST